MTDAKIVKGPISIFNSCFALRTNNFQYALKQTQSKDKEFLQTPDTGEMNNFQRLFVCSKRQGLFGQQKLWNGNWLVIFLNHPSLFPQFNGAGFVRYYL